MDSDSLLDRRKIALLKVLLSLPSGTRMTTAALAEHAAEYDVFHKLGGSADHLVQTRYTLNVLASEGLVVSDRLSENLLWWHATSGAHKSKWIRAEIAALTLQHG